MISAVYRDMLLCPLINCTPSSKKCKISQITKKMNIPEAITTLMACCNVICVLYSEEEFVLFKGVQEK